MSPPNHFFMLSTLLLTIVFLNQPMNVILCSVMLSYNCPVKMYSLESHTSSVFVQSFSPQGLPCLEDAWNAPISQEMRQNSIQRANQGLIGKVLAPSIRAGFPPNKR